MLLELSIAALLGRPYLYLLFAKSNRLTSQRSDAAELVTVRT